MIIDLKNYVNEVAALVETALPFIARPSEARFRDVLADLERGRDNPPFFPWRTIKPIETIVARNYDSHAGTQAPVYATFGFDATFRKVGNHKSNDWAVERMNTHLKVFAEGKANALIHLHVDKKNTHQLGPEVHLQVSENCTHALGGLKLGVPRIPFGFLLPTDCLDFLLAEFFSVEWGKAQAGAHRIAMLKNAQMRRASVFATSVQNAWRNAPRQTPVSVLQNCSFAGDLHLG